MRKNQRMRRWVLREMDRLSDERQRNQPRTGWLPSAKAEVD